MPSFILPEPKPDPLLQLIGRYKNDSRSNKIDLGVGVYRDSDGHTPVMQAVKAAETQLQTQQQSKSYLGLTGDIEFVECLSDLMFGSVSHYVKGAQTPGGSGALRLAAELYHTVNPTGTLWVGLPTWPNHLPLTSSAGVPNKSYQYYDPKTHQLHFSNMLEAVESAQPGDAILLHGCCHNPTGADLSKEQWQQLANAIAAHQLTPIIDIAYHGLGTGWDEDLYSTRLIASQCPQTLVATSCSKNFGMYRDRTGAVYMISDNKQSATRAQALFGQIARQIYSMPPDHGAAVVRIILQNPTLKQQWQDELVTMVERINSLRRSIADIHPALDFVAQQRGMFSLLPLSPDQVNSLIEDHAVYLAGDGRINVAGCQHSQMADFASALKAVSLIS